MTMPTIPDDASDREGDHLPAPVIDHRKAKAQGFSR